MRRFLRFLSEKVANKARLHINPEWLGILIAWPIWLLVEVLAKVTKDNERLVDTMGQRALIVRQAHMYNWAESLLTKCVNISISLPASLFQVYLAERAVVFALMENPYAIKDAETALKAARYQAEGDILIRLVQLAGVYNSFCQQEKAWMLYDEAIWRALSSTYSPSHPYHRIKALKEAALFQHGKGHSNAAIQNMESALTLALEGNFRPAVQEIKEILERWGTK